jgi:hypothetical protein
MNIKKVMNILTVYNLYQGGGIGLNNGTPNN